MTQDPQSIADLLDAPLSEAELDALSRMDAPDERALHVRAIRAVREIRRLRAALLADVKLDDGERCPACDCPYATEAQRARPEYEYPLLCRRKLEGDVCKNPPMDWRHRARKFEGALALAVKYAGMARADRDDAREELRLIDLALKPLDQQPPLTRGEFLAAVVQEVQAHREPRPVSRGRRR